MGATYLILTFINILGSIGEGGKDNRHNHTNMQCRSFFQWDQPPVTILKGVRNDESEIVGGKGADISIGWFYT